ncbi:MAG: DNA replication and repair protein RecF, partial [Oscillospiraceae bacterium]
YLPLLNQYGRLLTQRNSLLKAIRTAGGMIETLDVWDSALAKAGTLIQTTRESYVKRLAPFAQEVYHGIARGREAVSFAYRKAGFDAESDLAALLAQTRADDLRIGSTTVGPHRDDLEVLIDGVSARAYGSQGQQRSAVLALKLGECALIEEVAQEQPVVLLDDVMSELDESRRDYLLHRMDDRQVFITCCDPGQIVGISGEAVFEIADGRLKNR